MRRLQTYISIPLLFLTVGAPAVNAQKKENNLEQNSFSIYVEPITLNEVIERAAGST